MSVSQINKIFSRHISGITLHACSNVHIEEREWTVNPSFVEWVIEQSFVHNPLERVIGSLALSFDIAASGIKYVFDNTNVIHNDQSSFLRAYGQLFLRTERKWIYDFIVRTVMEHVRYNTIEYFCKKVADVEDPRFKTWYQRELYYRRPVQDKISTIPPRLERQTNRIALPFPVRCYNDRITFDMVWSVFEDDMKNRERWIDEIKDVIETYAIDKKYIADAEWYVDIAGWRAEHVKRRIENDLIITYGIDGLPRRSDRIRKRKRGL